MPLRYTLPEVQLLLKAYRIPEGPAAWPVSAQEAAPHVAQRRIDLYFTLLNTPEELDLNKEQERYKEMLDTSGASAAETVRTLYLWPSNNAWDALLIDINFIQPNQRKIYFLSAEARFDCLKSFFTAANIQIHTKIVSTSLIDQTEHILSLLFHGKPFVADRFNEQAAAARHQKKYTEQVTCLRETLINYLSQQPELCQKLAIQLKYQSVLQIQKQLSTSSLHSHLLNIWENHLKAVFSKSLDCPRPLVAELTIESVMQLLAEHERTDQLIAAINGQNDAAKKALQQWQTETKVRAQQEPITSKIIVALYHLLHTLLALFLPVQQMQTALSWYFSKTLSACAGVTLSILYCLNFRFADIMFRIVWFFCLTASTQYTRREVLDFDRAHYEQGASCANDLSVLMPLLMGSCFSLFSGNAFYLAKTVFTLLVLGLGVLCADTYDDWVDSDKHEAKKDTWSIEDKNSRTFTLNEISLLCSDYLFPFIFIAITAIDWLPVYIPSALPVRPDLHPAPPILHTESSSGIPFDCFLNAVGAAYCQPSLYPH